MASLFPTIRGTRPWSIRMLAVLLAIACCGMGGKKPAITIRFFAEANQLDSEKFAQAINLHHPPRQAFIQRIPVVHEKQIKAVYPFQASDGSWGCAFKLDNQGRLALEVVSTEKRGRTLVAFIGTKAGIHLAAELLIDRPITDGIISLPTGLTELEIGAITKAWPVLGQQKKKR